MHGSGDKIPKRRIDVEVELEDGTVLEGALFVTAQGRLQDLLNDERRFLPFTSADSAIMFLGKSAISRVILRDGGGNGAGTGDESRRQSAPAGNADPFALLGVSAASTPEALREAYKRLCREFHPDRIQALGLPKEFVEFATHRMADINAAYDRIEERRRSES
jgi:hypothetical protein